LELVEPERTGQRPEIRNANDVPCRKVHDADRLRRRKVYDDFAGHGFPENADGARIPERQDAIEAPIGGEQRKPPRPGPQAGGAPIGQEARRGRLDVRLRLVEKSPVDGSGAAVDEKELLPAGVAPEDAGAVRTDRKLKDALRHRAGPPELSRREVELEDRPTE